MNTVTLMGAMGGNFLQQTRLHFLAWMKVWFPVLLCIGVIFVESTQSMSGKHTDRILRPIWSWIFGPVSDSKWDIIHFSIRKTGHFTGYGLTALTWLRAWRMQWSGWFKDARQAIRWPMVMALFCTAVVASSDEVHQSYLSDRTGQLSDVLLDCTGAAIFLGCAWMVLRLRSRKNGSVENGLSAHGG